MLVRVSLVEHFVLLGELGKRLGVISGVFDPRQTLLAQLVVTLVAAV